MIVRAYNTLYKSMVQAASNRGIQSIICRWKDHVLRNRRIQARLLDTSWEVLAMTLGPIISPYGVS